MILKITDRNYFCNKGFSLVEVILSVSIVSLIAIAMMTLVNQFQNDQILTGKAVKYVMLMKQVMNNAL